MFLEGLEGIFRIEVQWELSVETVERSTRVRQGYAKPSSSILYGNIRKNTDLKREGRKLAKQCKKTDGLKLRIHPR
jgi:hypothetical protein